MWIWSVVCVNWVNMDQTWMSNMNLLWELTIVISQLCCLFRKPNAVLLTIKQVTSITSYSVYSFDVAMWAFASKCNPIQLVPCSDGLRRAWWHTIHKITELPVSSSPQSKYNRHEQACLESFWSNLTFGAYICWSWPCFEHDLWAMVAQVTNKNTLIYERDSNLREWCI